MARLDPKPYPIPAFDYSDVRGSMKREEEALAPIADKIIAFPVADNYARYYVKSLKPLVLQHIPTGDAYAIPAAHLRGLTTRDVEKQLKGNRMMRELFARKESH